MEKVDFSFDDVKVYKKTEDVLKKYKDLLEEPFAEALENNKTSTFAAKLHKEVASEDREIVVAFVGMVIAIHRFTQVGG